MTKASITMSHADDGTLHAYLDGELTALERAGLEAHLAGCPACRARLEEERDLVERAQGLLSRAAPPAASLPPLLRSGGSGRARPLPRWVPLAWAASVLLALGGGWLARGEPARGPEVPELALERVEPAPIVDSVRRGDVPTTVELREQDAARPAEGAASGVQPGRAPTAKATAAEERGEAVGAVAAPSRAAANQAGRLAAPPSAQALAPRAEAVEPAARVAAANTGDAIVWRSVTVDSARTILGAEPVAIPGVPIRRYGVSGRGDGVVLIEQALDAATVVQLFERRADAGRDEGAQPFARARAQESARPGAVGATERLARYVAALRVEIAGPVSADSLSRLLGMVAPIR